MPISILQQFAFGGVKSATIGTFDSHLCLFCFCRISDCSDDVVSIFTGSNVFEFQALSAMLLAKLISADLRVQTDQSEQILDAISTTLGRLTQVCN